MDALSIDSSSVFTIGRLIANGGSIVLTSTTVVAGLAVGLLTTEADGSTTGRMTIGTSTAPVRVITAAGITLSAPPGYDVALPNSYLSIGFQGRVYYQARSEFLDTTTVVAASMGGIYFDGCRVSGYNLPTQVNGFGPTTTGATTVFVVGNQPRTLATGLADIVGQVNITGTAGGTLHPAYAFSMINAGARVDIDAGVVLQLDGSITHNLRGVVAGPGSIDSWTARASAALLLENVIQVATGGPFALNGQTVTVRGGNLARLSGTGSVIFADARGTITISYSPATYVNTFQVLGSAGSVNIVADINTMTFASFSVDAGATLYASGTGASAVTFTSLTVANGASVSTSGIPITIAGGVVSGAVANTGSAATITLSGTGSLAASASIVTLLPTTLVLAGGSVATGVTGAASLLVSITANSTLGSFASTPSYTSLSVAPGAFLSYAADTTNHGVGTILLAGGSGIRSLTTTAVITAGVIRATFGAGSAAIDFNRVKLTSSGNFTIDAHAGENQFVFSGGARLRVGGSTPIICAGCGAGVNLHCQYQ